MPALAADVRRTRTRIAGYIAALPPDGRRAAKQIRATIRAAAPRAVEHFSYGMPGFRLDGKVLLWYAAWKTHSSVYPITRGMEAAHASVIAPFRHGRGTLRFDRAATVPTALIAKLVRTRAREIASGGK